MPQLLSTLPKLAQRLSGNAYLAATVIGDKRALNAGVLSVLLLAGCNTMPASSVDVAENPSPAAQSPEPELTLNLPEHSQCVCVEDDVRDLTFLEKGFESLEAGDHIEAVKYFQRYQRLESSPIADWEAGIAIAYDSMLAHSPFYAPAEAAQSYQSLKRQLVDDERVHGKVLLLRDALETFAALRAQVDTLNRDKAALEEDLAKREEALKRLRELTLGQRGAGQ